ncbi:hypothetical protein [Campylobacter magnus]|uniref:hypothetical protein n=1 Tax=Campylobacter magnus TaxID=3026462 RepID=UPI0026DEDA69|nr:hypothetical protein [Campylobacter magnus]MDO2407680.1 hypothetical protein [Campylobacter magnus]
MCGDFFYSQCSASRGAVSTVAAGEISCRFFKAVATEKRCESFARTSWTGSACEYSQAF